VPWRSRAAGRREIMVELNEKERDYLLTVLLAAHTQLMHELHHADSNEYKTQLRRQIELNEAATMKVQDRVASVV
jgi:hypothetical protein